MEVRYQSKVGSTTTNSGARKLKEYWVHGAGAAKIRWGVPRDFYRCVAHLGKYVANPQGLCNVYHRAALGVAPGQEKGHKVDGTPCCDECLTSEIVAIVDVGRASRSLPRERKDWSDMRLSPQELHERAIRGWVTRRRGGHYTPPPISHRSPRAGSPPGQHSPPRHPGFGQASGGRPNKPARQPDPNRFWVYTAQGATSGTTHANTAPSKPRGRAKAPAKAKQGEPQPFPNAGVPRSRTEPLTPEQVAERKRWNDKMATDPVWGGGGPHDSSVKYRDPQTGYWTPERQAQQDAIVDDFLRQAKDIPNDHKALIVGGLGGSGKSKILGNPDIVGKLGIEVKNGAPSNFMLIDSDEVKQRLIELEDPADRPPGLTPAETSPLVHRESSIISKRIAAAAVAQGKNVIWNVTMRDRPDTEESLVPLDDNGYEIRGLFVDVSTEKAAASAERRWIGGLDNLEINGNGLGGRFLPSGRIYGQATVKPDMPQRVPGAGGRMFKPRSNNRATFQSLLDDRWFDGAIVVDNEGTGLNDYPQQVVLTTGDAK
jgi:hypothetical protein